MKNCKVLIIASGAYISGAEVITLDVIFGLKRMGFDIHCLVNGWNDGDFISKLKSNEVPFTEAKFGWYYLNKPSWTFDSLINYPKALWQFLKLKKKFHADIVYTISFRQIALLYPFLNRNIFYHVHDPNSHSAQSKFFLKLINKKVKKYLAVSKFIAEDLAKCGLQKSKIELVYNGVGEEEQMVDFNLNNILTIGIIGQIIERKGHLVVVDALKILRDRNVEVKLVIVGRGEVQYIDLVNKKINEYDLTSKVEWRGYLKNINDIYRGIDVVVAPTQNEEPFGLMACEANMFGKPAIVSIKGGLPEIIVNGENGFCINPNSAEDLANKIEYFTSNRNAIKLMGEKGRTRVITYFTKEKMIESVAKVLSNN